MSSFSYKNYNHNYKPKSMHCNCDYDWGIILVVIYIFCAVVCCFVQVKSTSGQFRLRPTGRSRIGRRPKSSLLPKGGWEEGGEGWGPRRVPAGGVWRRSGGAGCPGEESGGPGHGGRSGQSWPDQAKEETWPKRNLAKVELAKVVLAKVEIGQSRPGQSGPQPVSGAPTGGGSRRVGAPKGGAQNFGFFSSPATIHSFFPLLGVFSWNFGVCLKRWTLECACLEFSGCRVEPRRPPKYLGTVSACCGRFSEQRKRHERPTCPFSFRTCLSGTV